MTARARQAADKALRHPRLSRLMAVIPTIDRVNPKALREWLIVAADADPKGAQSEAFIKAYGAVEEWGQVSALSDRASAAFYNPQLRAEFGEERLKAAWRDPESAYAELVAASATGKLSPAAAEALEVLAGAREMASSSGDGAWQSRQSTLPVIANQVDREAAELVKKSATTRLTPHEDHRLKQLYEAKTLRDERNAAVAEAAANRPKPPPGRREQLIQKSATQRLTVGEQREVEAIYASLHPPDDDSSVSAGTTDYADDDGDYEEVA